MSQPLARPWEAALRRGAAPSERDKRMGETTTKATEAESRGDIYQRITDQSRRPSRSGRASGGCSWQIGVNRASPVLPAAERITGGFILEKPAADVVCRLRRCDGLSELSFDAALGHGWQRHDHAQA